MKKLLALVSSALVAVLVMTSPLAIAQDVGPPASLRPPPGAANSTVLEQTDTEHHLAGFFWGHCEEVWRFTGDSWTYCYWFISSSHQGWVRTNDDKCQDIFIEAAGSYHWIGLNITSFTGGYGNISYCRLWKTP